MLGRLYVARAAAFGLNIHVGVDGVSEIQSFLGDATERIGVGQKSSTFKNCRV
jgi:hypothetical protein